jgi:hypothetical protein
VGKPLMDGRKTLLFEINRTVLVSFFLNLFLLVESNGQRQIFGKSTVNKLILIDYPIKRILISF